MHKLHANRYELKVLVHRNAVIRSAKTHVKDGFVFGATGHVSLAQHCLMGYGSPGLHDD